MSVGAIITAFIRPSGMSVSDGKIYLWTLAISLLITLDIPFLIYSFYGKKHQKVEGDNHENDEGRV
jgi:hypothetical protein